MNKGLNKEILDSITAHKDFGTVNPVDIGIQCGYKEADVQEVIESSCSYKKKCNDETQDKYYFALTKNFNETIREEVIDIVAFDLSRKSLSVVKQIERKSQYDIVKIKGSILAKTRYDTEYVYWENIETGENRVFDVGASIIDVLIVENGIIVVCKTRECYKDIVKINLSGERKCLQIESAFNNGQVIIEHANKIYEICHDQIWRVDEHFETVEKIHDIYGSHLFAVGFSNEDIYCYTNRGEFLYGKHLYGKQTEEMFKEEMRQQFTYQYSGLDEYYQVIETQNYRVLGEIIYNKKTEKSFKIKGIHEGIDNMFSVATRKGERRTQIISLYEKDIILFVWNGSLVGVLDFNLGEESYYAPLSV